MSLSVALLYAGGRVDKVRDPLLEVGVDVTVNSPDPYDHDAVVLDTPGPWIARHTLLSGDTPVLYRLRGNLWKARRHDRLGSVKTAIADTALLPRLDGVLTPDGRLDEMMRDRVGIDSTAPVGLPIAPTEWDDAEHVGDVLTMVTLTNLDYREKIAPLYRYAPAVERFCERHGGHWHICGDGVFEEGFAEAVGGLEHVSFDGFVDAKARVQAADVMLHLSDFDIAHPNAVLEGMAGNLPVVVNGFEGFEGNPETINAGSPAELLATLERLRDPSERRQHARRGQEYIREKHTHERIGNQARHFIEEVVASA